MGAVKRLISKLRNYFRATKRADLADFQLWPRFVYVDMDSLEIRARPRKRRAGRCITPANVEILIDGKRFAGINKIVLTIDADGIGLPFVDLRVCPDLFKPESEVEG